MKHVLIGGLLAAGLMTPVTAQTEVTLARFFGACEDAGTDTTASAGEACIIQSIINAASELIDGVTVTTLPTDWGNYYDQLKAAYAGGTPPDIHVMHRHRVPEFAGFGALSAIGDDLESVGIDPGDWSEKARQAVTYEGQIYGVPMDFHANLWHINMDLMEQAGLVEDGKPILPSSPEELLEHAQKMKEATGQNYLAADFAQFPIGVRLVLALLWQQGENIFTEDGTATINTDAGKRAVETITQLFDAGLADPQLNYADSQQAFLNGEAAVLVNGTWVVDFYTAEAAKEETGLDNYYAASFPTLFDEPATWADTPHVGYPLAGKAGRGEVSGGAQGPGLHQRAQHRLGAHGTYGGPQLGARKRCLQVPAASGRVCRHRRDRTRHAADQELRRDPGRAQPRVAGNLVDGQVGGRRAFRRRDRGSGRTRQLSGAGGQHATGSVPVALSARGLRDERAMSGGRSMACRASPRLG